MAVSEKVAQADREYAEWQKNRRPLVHLLRKSGHDVSGEARGEGGKWSKAGDNYRIELKQYFDGTIPVTRRQIEVATPSKKLKEAGVNGAIITLKLATLRRKNNRDYEHEYTYENLKDLPEAVNNPIMVFDHPNGNKDIITTMTMHGRNVLVGLETVSAGRDIHVERIATLFGKRSDTILKWINEGRQFWYDKQKAHEWLSFQQGTNCLDYPTTIEPSGTSIPFIEDSGNNNLIKALLMYEINKSLAGEMLEIKRIGKVASITHRTALPSQGVEQPSSFIALRKSRFTSDMTINEQVEHNNLQKQNVPSAIVKPTPQNDIRKSIQHIPMLIKSRKLDGSIDFNGLQISIETGRSRMREWHDPQEQRPGIHPPETPAGFLRRFYSKSAPQYDENFRCTIRKSRSRNPSAFSEIHSGTP